MIDLPEEPRSRAGQTHVSQSSGEFGTIGVPPRWLSPSPAPPYIRYDFLARP